MKSILVGLTLICSIASFPSYTQSDTTDTNYCLPISTARLLVADAIRLRYTDSLLNVQSERIELVESEKKSMYESYSNLLKIEREKYNIQKETTAHMESLANSWRDERDYYQKKYKKQRRQKGVLSVGLIGLIILVLVK